jgi:DNA-binding transcriptional ArsR family regulator
MPSPYYIIASLCNDAIMSDIGKIELEAELLSVLAQPTRLKILYFLRDGEQCACKINPQMREDSSVVSRHLVRMREAGLLGSRREGVSIYYWIREPRVFDLLRNVDDLLRAIMREKNRSAEVLETQ